MKWIKWVAAYAAVVFTGGTMQSINTIPYPDPMKDGHEFTRDVMAGVLLKSSIEDAFAGVPMFGRYADMFNFQKAVNPSIESRMSATMIATNENKLREIAWLPALHFSAEAGELEQVSYEWPIETFGQKESLSYNSAKYKSAKMVGVAHSSTTSYLLHEAIPMFPYLNKAGYNIQGLNYASFYSLESAPTTLYELRGENGEHVTLNYGVFTYKNIVLATGRIEGQPGIIRIKDNMKASMFKSGGSITWVAGSIVFSGSDSGLFIDLDTGREMTMVRLKALVKNLVGAEDWEVKFVRKYQKHLAMYPPSTGISRFSGFGSYASSTMVNIIRSHPDVSKEVLALEWANTGSLDRGRLSILRMENRIAESADVVRYSSGTGADTYAISKDFKGYEDTRVPVDSFVSLFRSHNYLYVAPAGSFGRYKLRNNPVYGNKHYIERGRAWQH